MQNFPGAQIDQNNWIDMSNARDDEDLSAPCSGRTYDTTGDEWGAFALPSFAAIGTDADWTISPAADKVAATREP